MSELRVKREREEIVFTIRFIPRVLCCTALAVALLGGGALSAAPNGGGVGYLLQNGKGCQQAMSYEAYVARVADSLRASPPQRAFVAPSLKREIPKIPGMKRVNCFNQCDYAQGACAAECDLGPPNERFACYDNCFWTHEFCYCDCGLCGGFCGC